MADAGTLRDDELFGTATAPTSTVATDAPEPYIFILTVIFSDVDEATTSIQKPRVMPSVVSVDAVDAHMGPYALRLVASEAYVDGCAMSTA